MVIENGNKPADVARMFDIHRSQIDRWVAQFRDDTGEAFPGNGNRKPSDEELRRLRQENAELKQERDEAKREAAVARMDGHVPGDGRVGWRRGML